MATEASAPLTDEPLPQQRGCAQLGLWIGSVWLIAWLSVALEQAVSWTRPIVAGASCARPLQGASRAVQNMPTKCAKTRSSWNPGRERVGEELFGLRGGRFPARVSV